MTRSPLDAWIARTTGIHGPDPVVLRRWQIERLSSLAQWARQRSPFYAERLRGLADKPFANPARIPALPFTTAEHLRAHSEHMLCVSRGEVDRVVTLATSGTTGKPKRLFFTEEDLAATLDFFRVGMASFTGPGDAVLILLPGRREDGAALLLARALSNIGVRPVLSPQPCSPDEALRLAHEQKVTCLAAIPSQLAALLDLASDRRHWPPGLDRALLSGEPVPGELRQAALAAGIEIFAHYGLTETCFGGGVECRAHHGYHLREADLFVEIADPLTGQAVPDGGEGEVVVSTLSRRGMPLLRYRTGDVARMLPGPCPCGSPLRRLGPVTGRIERTEDGFQVSVPEKGTANSI
jgi:phenylacetate-coenzyme A ligase PaaK-like adenylate-forming protein